MSISIILEIIYYVIALITFILFKRKRITVTYNGKEVTKKVNKYITVIQIAASIAWPLTLIMVIINFIKGR